MPNQIGLSGGQPQKQVRFAPIYTGRWASGLWTNRSPLRDGTTSRISEKFYGAAGDALIDGLNVEITNRLTLARRPGHILFDTNSYTAVDSFKAFRMFGPNLEQINVMIDEANQLSSLYAGTKSLVWTKTPPPAGQSYGQTFMQSVGNTLYFGNGIDNKKWLQSLVVWSAGAQWNGPTTPFLTTFLIDPNGNIQQLTGTGVSIASTSATSGVVTITLNATAQPGGVLTDIIAPGLSFTFPSGMTGSAAQLDGKTVTISTVTGTVLTANNTPYTDYSTQVEASALGQVISGFPVSGSVAPAWSTVQPNAGNDFQGGITQDGTVQWTNRGITWAAPNAGSDHAVENWGIALPPGITQNPGVNSSREAWNANTYYSNPGVIIDGTYGNVQVVTVDGISGTTDPGAGWGNLVGATTTDGTVTWTTVQLAPLAWVAGTAYTPGTFVTGATGGTGTCLFRLQSFPQPLLKNGNVDIWTWNHDHSLLVGDFVLLPPVVAGSPNTGVGGTVNAYINHAVVNSLSGATPVASSPGDGDGGWWNTQSDAGEWVSNAQIEPQHANIQSVISGILTVTTPGQYTFTMNHHDGCFIGFGGGATKVSGVFTDDPAVSPARTTTAMFGYDIVGGTDKALSGNTILNDTVTVNFPAAGDYPFEIDYAYWYHSSSTEQPVMVGAPSSKVYMEMVCNGKTIVTTIPKSGANTPVWPDWTLANAPAYPTIADASGSMIWENLGPIGDFVWTGNQGFTLPDQQIVDTNGNLQASYRTGATGAAGTEPDSSAWQTGINQLTLDNPNLIWINQGPATATTLSGTMSAFSDQGWRYWIALVNTLDDTVSNAVPLNPTSGTGKIIGANQLVFSPGQGLPPVSQIDPQADYVAIYRSTDGLAVPFLIPGVNSESFYTISLHDYLTNGYSDNTPDTGLDNLIQGAIGGENTPPAGGAVNLTYHLNRIFFSVGNVVYWTSGPDTPDGNGLNGVAPLNFDELPSSVSRIVPTVAGAFVFTVSDIYVILGNGTTNSPIQSAIPFLQGIGLRSYNALDINGSIMGLFTTDNQFIQIEPNGGVSSLGFPIGDRFRKNNGQPGTSWNSKNIYVVWHVDGEDAAWYVSDGAYGWYRLIPTPSPESGTGNITWSPFAKIIGGVKAIQSIEVTPGVHKLLLGPTGTGSILNRDLSVFSDNGETYPAWAVIGSAVLAQPGQIAEVAFITTESVNTGTPLVLGVLMNEAWPYFTGPFEILKIWENDPPGLPKSRSILGQRFYMSEKQDETAVCRHMQMQIVWSEEAAANELLSLTIFGAYSQEV